MLGTSEVATFIATTDAERSRDFYHGILGLSVISEDPNAVVFDANGITLRIQKVQNALPAPHTTRGWHVTDIEKIVAELSAFGIVFEMYDGISQDELGISTFPGGAKVAWFKDPDRNLLSLDEY